MSDDMTRAGRRVPPEKIPPAPPIGGTTRIEATLAERGGRYGDFTSNARISQALLATMKREAPADAWERLDPVKRESLTVIAAKIARILNGDPEYDDNWRDIAGYATLALQRCKPS